MANEYLEQFDPKTTPVSADLVYIADSAASFLEKKTTIAQIITNNAIATVAGSPVGGDLVLIGAGNQLKDSGIAVDGSQNVTGINTLALSGAITSGTQAATKTYADTKFAIANNLSEGTPATMRTSLGLGTAAVKTASSSGTTVASVTGTFTIGHVATFSDNSGTIQDGGATSQFFLVANDLSEGIPATMRTNLGLGSAALKTASGSGPTLASVTGAFTVGHLATFSDTSGTIQDGGSTATFLLSADDLSDVGSAETSFDNISPLTTIGDTIYFNGNHNVRLPATTNGYIYTLASGVPSWQPAQAATGFVDNATFVGTTGQGVSSSSPTPIKLDTLLQQTTGGTWTTNGDTTGMKCGQAGTYRFIGICPINSGSSVLANYGLLYCRFAKNGTVLGPMMPYNAPDVTTQWIGFVTVTSEIVCAVNDVITFCVYSGTPAATYNVPGPLVTGAVNAASVDIERLL